MNDITISSNLAVSENGFLFLPTTGESFTLNPTGILVLNALKEGKESTVIIKMLIDEYDIDTATAEKDFHDFVSQLKNHNLIIEK